MAVQEHNPNLPSETCILYELYVLDYLVASRGVQWYMQIGDCYLMNHACLCTSTLESLLSIPISLILPYLCRILVRRYSLRLPYSHS